MSALPGEATAEPADRTGDEVRGEIFYTRYLGSPNLGRIAYRYGADGFVLGERTPLAALAGADGLVFAPDGDLIVGGQGDRIHKVRPDGRGRHRTVSAGGVPAYHVVMDPDGRRAWAMGTPGALVEIPLAPFADGVARPLAGDDIAISAIAFARAGRAYYTTGGDDGRGHFGVIDLGRFTTRRVLADLPAAHHLVFDRFTGDLLLFGGRDILQIDPLRPTEIKSRRRFEIPALFDQGAADGGGRLLVARVDGFLLFVDYAATGLVGDSGNVTAHAFVDANLDDIAPLSGPGSQLFVREGRERERQEAAARAGAAPDPDGGGRLHDRGDKGGDGDGGDGGGTGAASRNAETANPAVRDEESGSAGGGEVGRSAPGGGDAAAGLSPATDGTIAGAGARPPQPPSAASVASAPRIDDNARGGSRPALSGGRAAGNGGSGSGGAGTGPAGGTTAPAAEAAEAATGGATTGAEPPGPGLLPQIATIVLLALGGALGLQLGGRRGLLAGWGAYAGGVAALPPGHTIIRYFEFALAAAAGSDDTTTAPGPVEAAIVASAVLTGGAWLVWRGRRRGRRREERAASPDTEDVAGRLESILVAGATATDSRIGFVGQFVATEGDGRTLVLRAVYDRAAALSGGAPILRPRQAKLTLEQLAVLTNHRELGHNPIVAEGPRDPAIRRWLPPPLPAIRTLLMVPLRRQDEVVGVLGLANSPQGYDDDVIARLRDQGDELSGLLGRIAPGDAEQTASVDPVGDDHDRPRRPAAPRPEPAPASEGQGGRAPSAWRIPRGP